MIPRTSGTLRRARTGLLSCVLLLATTAPWATPTDRLHNKTCTTAECHPMPAPAFGVIDHAPFLEEWCDRCHGDHQAADAAALTRTQDAVCLKCHTAIETAGSHAAHPPGGDACLACHEPHRSSVRNLLREEAMLLCCGECHADDLAKAAERPHRHNFFDPKGECGTCHHAHQGSGEGYLRANLGETCLTCHDMPIQVEGRRLENIGREIREMKVVHAPLKEAMCQACHTPHGSFQPSLLHEDYPAGSYEGYARENYGLCWDCHSPALVEAHPAGAATRFRNGHQNLHQVHVMKLKRGRACHICHTAHATDTPHLIRDSITFGSWSGPLIYEADADGGSCATPCHREKDYRR